ncbi:MAG: hypothetical protein HY790_08520 [Deltaproteobacteria bacterium]|nr:hypothetical protein [Deltaproteobacteria bacterium]MBI4795862.1 hypothetical protein [Deltaproteobacteria bacterium]
MLQLKQYSALIGLLQKVDKPVGKTFLQKGIYILQEGLGEELGYDFRLHFYGPYSQDLANNINFLQDLGLISIDFDPTGYGYQIELTEYGTKFFKENLEEYKIDESKLNKIVSIIGKDYAREMELIGTTLYFAKLSNNDGEIKEMVNMVKPHFNGKDIEMALHKLREENILIF